MMKVVQVSEWNQFVQLTDALPGWAFRGELSAQWPLVTSLSRRLQTYCPEKALWPLREERAFFSMLPVLRTGEALSVGEAVNMPIRAIIERPPEGRRPDGDDLVAVVPKGLDGKRLGSGG